MLLATYFIPLLLMVGYHFCVNRKHSPLPYEHFLRKYFYFSALSHNSLSPGLLQQPPNPAPVSTLIPIQRSQRSFKIKPDHTYCSNPLKASHDIQNKFPIPCHGYEVLCNWAFVYLTKGIPYHLPHFWLCFTHNGSFSSTDSARPLPVQGLYTSRSLRWRCFPWVYTCFSPQHSGFCSNVTFSNAHLSHLPPYSLKWHSLGLPWWRNGWESACQCRGHGFEPCSGKIPHATEQLGPCATTTEPARLELVLRNKRGRDSERPVHRDDEWPPLATTRESPRTETKTQHSQK